MIDNVLNNMPPKKEPYYDEAEFAIVKGNTVFGNLMDDVRFYGELALVREGIEKIHEALPDYKYVPMRDVREAMKHCWIIRWMKRGTAAVMAMISFG